MTPDHEQHIYPETIMERDVPCWYELSWQEETSSILFKIHKDYIKNIQLIPADEPGINSLAQNFKLGSYSGDFSKDIGFNEVLKNRGEDGKGFVVFQIEIPQIKFKEGNWKPAYIISASLTILLSQLRRPLKEISTPFPQLLLLKTMTTDDRCAPFATLSLRLHNWLKLQEEKIVGQRVVSAMESADKRVFGEGMVGLTYNFRRLDNKAIAFGAPKARWEFGPDCRAESRIELGYGYEIVGDNINNPMQQLVLIAGLAALHDAARKENNLNIENPKASL